MKRRGAQTVSRQIAGMTIAQQLEFWQARTRAVRERKAKSGGTASRKSLRALAPRHRVIVRKASA